MKRLSLKDYLVIFILIIGIDRVSKLLALRYVSDHSIELTRFLSFELTFNRGISWGMFQAHNSIIFGIISLIIALVIITLGSYTYVRAANNKIVLGEIFVLAGALSNFADRIFYAGVIDFIVLSFGSFTWPVFNIADAAIVFGVAIMFYGSYGE